MEDLAGGFILTNTIGTILCGDDDRIPYKVWDSLTDLYGDDIWMGLVVADAKALQSASVVFQYHSAKNYIYQSKLRMVHPKFHNDYVI